MPKLISAFDFLFQSLKRMKYALDEIEENSKPRDKFPEGTRCDVLDYHMGREVWRTCRVLRTDLKEHSVFVHWEGWGHHWDEWIDVRLGRKVIAPLWTRVPLLTRTGKQCEFSATLTVGVATADGTLAHLAPRGAAFFPTASTTLSTCLDDQRSAIVRIYQGERPRAKDNRLLGEFVIHGLPPAPQGVPQIRLTATLHPDGLLSVRARCETAGVLAGLDVTAAPGPEDVEKALNDARDNAEADQTSAGKNVDPWEERKCRRWEISNALCRALGSDVSDLVDSYDDELRYSLCVAPVGGGSGLEPAGLAAFEADDEEEDVALVVPAMERL
eukprot:1237509-Amorphochlora_amoeboformis.AAC.2